MEAHTGAASIGIASREDGHPLWGGRCYFDPSPLWLSDSIGEIYAAKELHLLPQRVLKVSEKTSFDATPSKGLGEVSNPRDQTLRLP